MTALVIALFWSCVCLVAYAYVGYPLLTAALARHHGTRPELLGNCHGHGPASAPPITVVVCAFDEEARIGARITDILAQDYPAACLQVLVVSDGSRDRTADVALAAAAVDPRVHVLALPENHGKAGAVNAAMAQIHTPLVAFTDVRQHYAAGALRALVAPFSDPRVGAVSGELVILDAPSKRDGDANPSEGGIYWRMEKRLRADEARLQWLHGVSGSVYAVRRELFKEIPPGTILDDMWVPLQISLADHWVWMSRDAIAYDQASAHPGEEFERKLRTLAGNWQLVSLLPVLLNPWRNPVFFAWFSHKFLRLIVPWAMLLAVVCSALAPGAFYRFAFLAQLSAYACAALGLRLPELARHIPLLSAAATFLMLNLASLLSLPASLSGDSSRLWKKH